MRKRGNGEGTFYQLPSGKWRAQATIHGTRVGVVAKTHKEAQEQLRKLLSDADKGLLPPTEKPTLAVHIERWLTDVAQPSVRSRTTRGYRDIARLHILPTLGALRLTQLQPSHVQALYSKLTAAGLSAKSVRNVHAVLRRALNQAVEWHLVPRNVALLAHPPRAPRHEVVALSADDARRLLHSVRGDRWAALLAVALATGMRQSELLGLKWSDVHVASGTIRVQRQLGRDGLYAEPKTAKGRRTIDLPASCVAILKDHKRQQNEERLLVGPDWQYSDLVFCTHAGRPLSQRNVHRAFKRLLDRHGIPDVPFHALRHTHATLLLAQGTHPKVVQERLGHATIAMTLDIYSAYVPSMGRSAADQLDALLA